MPDDRELAREILSGEVSVAEVGRGGGGVKAGGEKAGPVTAAPAVLPGAVPEAKAPTVTGSPETGRKFPCKNCGARLDFDPSERALKCPYCGHVEEIAPAKGKVEEHDFEAALGKIEKEEGTLAGRSSEVKCPGCGATVLLEDNVETAACPFCATHLENVPRTKASEMICPESLLPFAISQRQSIEKFNEWIKTRWFAPSDLKSFANLGQLSGVYLPYWTYDDMTYSHYTGQRGDDYWVTETYTTTENGRTVTRTREVRKTRWTYVSGEVDHFFDDVLVCASTSLPGNFVTSLEPWDLEDLQGFDAAFLAGFKTERYVVTLGDGFRAAQAIMAPQIRRLIEQDIGGDHQSISSVSTQDVGVTYKHILLPLWLAVYRYRDQTYRILVNARSGQVCGARPYSAMKIAMAVLLGILVVVVIWMIVAANQGQHVGRNW